MKRTRAVLALTFWMAAIGPATLQAQQYLYTNNSVQSDRGGNSVSAFSVNSDGVISPIATYLTGGLGNNGFFFSQIGIATAQTSTGQCVFAADGDSNDIAGFTINMTDGTLQAVAGSPFASGGALGAAGLGLAVSNTSGQPLLFAGNPLYNVITAFVINPNCTLQGQQIFSVAGSPIGLKATPDGKFLIASYSLGLIDSFRIGADGSLVELGPFGRANTTAFASGVDISCDSTTAYFGDAGQDTQVAAYSIASTGRLRLSNGFRGTAGIDSNNVLLSTDDKTLFVSTTLTPMITALTVSPHSGLKFDATTSLHGSVGFALGLATTQSGGMLFVVEDHKVGVGVFKVSGSTLTEVSGSPFPAGDPNSLSLNLVAVPGKSCK